MKPYTIALLFLACLNIAAAQESQLTLDRALTLARANRPSIQAAQLRVTTARMVRRSLGAFPATRLFVGYTNDPAVGGSDDDLVLSQPLDIFGRTAAAKSSGDAGILKAEAELQQVVASMQAEIVTTYSEAAAAKALSDSAKKSLEISQRLYDAVKTLVDEGKLAGVQLTRVGIEVERSRLTANQRDAEYKSSVELLSGLLNIEIEQVSISAFPSIQVDLIEGSLLQKQRADLLLLAAEVRSAEADTRIARQLSLPELELQGRRSAWQDSETRYGARIQLSIPLFDYGRARSETAAARLREEGAKRSLADATRLAESELKAAGIELTAAREQITRYQTILASARRLVEVSEIGFTEKAVTLIELLEGTRALREVEEGYVEAQLRLAKAQSRYLQASGRILEVRP